MASNAKMEESIDQTEPGKAVAEKSENFEVGSSEKMVQFPESETGLEEESNLDPPDSDSDQLSPSCRSLVIVQAENNTPFWYQMKNEVDRVINEYIDVTGLGFVSYSKTATFLKHDINFEGRRVLFQDVKRHKDRPQQITYDGVPYMTIGKKVYDCEYGVDRSKAAKEMRLKAIAIEALQEEMSSKENKKIDKKARRRREPPPSRKWGCPCQIVVRDTVAFPDYKSAGNTEFKKKKATKMLLKDLKENKEIVMMRKAYISFPSIHDHETHPDIPPKRRRPKRQKIEVKTEPGYDYYHASKLEAGTTMAASSWSTRMLELVKKLNNFNPSAEKYLCRPLMVNGTKCGMIPIAVLNELQSYQQVFPFIYNDSTGDVEYVTITEQFKTAKERSMAVNDFMVKLKEKNLFPVLDGWRNELYAVRASYGGDLLFEMERAATCLFGTHAYGVHLNGFVKDSENNMSMWIGKRSDNKQTWPGKYDNMVGGGLTSGMTIQEVLIKECFEEAAISEELAKQAKPAGSVSYSLEDERGIFPETQFIFDLEIPSSFKPVNTDGEVQSFHLLSIEEVKVLIATEEFKPNCALIILDFFIRHGIIHPDEEPYYNEFVKGTHS